MSKRVKIAGVGSYLPPYVIDSDAIDKFLGIKSIGWLRRHLGIEERRFTGPLDFEKGIVKCEFSDVDMACRAAAVAMKNAEVIAEDIDALIYVTCTQEKESHLKFSGAVMELRHRMELCNARDMIEIDSGCAGSIQAVRQASTLINAKAAKTVLVVASNSTSSFVDRDLYLKEDAWLSIGIFGDGASALVIQESKGKTGHIIADTYCDGDPTVHLMDAYFVGGKLVYKIRAQAVRDSYPVLMTRAIKGLANKVAFSLNGGKKGVDYVLFHQANPFLLKKFTKELSIKEEKVIENARETGNLSAATIGELLHRGVADGRIREGSRILLCSVGAGGRPGAYLGASLIIW